MQLVRFPILSIYIVKARFVEVHYREDHLLVLVYMTNRLFLVAVPILLAAVFYQSFFPLSCRSADMAGVTHMVAFKLKEDASEEAIQRLVDSCKTLGDLPIVKDITVHRDMGLDKERNHHMMFLVKFNTIEDYREYSTHPVHMEIMRTILLPILEPGSRTALQFSS